MDRETRRSGADFEALVDSKAAGDGPSRRLTEQDLVGEFLKQPARALRIRFRHLRDAEASRLRHELPIEGWELGTPSSDGGDDGRLPIALELRDARPLLAHLRGLRRLRTARRPERLQPLELRPDPRSELLDDLVFDAQKLVPLRRGQERESLAAGAGRLIQKLLDQNALSLGNEDVVERGREPVDPARRKLFGV